MEDISICQDIFPDPSFVLTWMKVLSKVLRLIVDRDLTQHDKSSDIVEIGKTCNTISVHLSLNLGQTRVTAQYPTCRILSMYQINKMLRPRPCLYFEYYICKIKRDFQT